MAISLAGCFGNSGMTWKQYRPFKVESLANGDFRVSSKKLKHRPYGEKELLPKHGVFARMAMACEIQEYLNKRKP